MEQPEQEKVQYDGKDISHGTKEQVTHAQGAARDVRHVTEAIWLAACLGEYACFYIGSRCQSS